MNDYKYILKRAFKASFGVLVFLALVQPFGMNDIDEWSGSSHLMHALLHSLLTFFSALAKIVPYMEKAKNGSSTAGRVAERMRGVEAFTQAAGSRPGADRVKS